jgi:hypothetical protein
MSVLFFLFGPLLLLVVLVSADARGHSVRDSLAETRAGALRYVALVALLVTFVGVMISLGR